MRILVCSATSRCASVVVVVFVAATTAAASVVIIVTVVHPVAMISVSPVSRRSGLHALQIPFDICVVLASSLYSQATVSVVFRAQVRRRSRYRKAR